MPIKARKQGITTMVEIEGQLDATNHSTFEAEIGALLAGGNQAFVFDCEKPAYVISIGLRALLSLRKRAHAAGISMRMCRLQPAVSQVFEISGFNNIFELYPSLESESAPSNRLSPPPNTSFPAPALNRHEFQPGDGLRV